ncbi:MAG: tail fiber domain-containing protein, partial [Bacteroidia bacterium]|nr:tail fiber domain-containing protein [Bacteroidia bacterium]
MGSSRLWSVPYSMIAGNLAGSVEKLAVAGTTSALDEALFEVKNKNGQTIFAVYNEGVRIYVDDGAKGTKGGFAVGGFDMTKATKREYLVVSDDSIRMYLDSNPLTKGKKGGFAVGGFDMTKGVIQNYLDVSTDSIRMYIDDKGKGKKGGFAVGGFDNTKGGNANFLNVTTDANGIINPAQNRILWYPLKNAFLTGRVLIESPSSVGENSFATGYESKAKGMYSQAMGYKSFAGGNYSTAIGKYASADYENSFAFGNQAKALNAGAYAFGTGAQATAPLSFALGSVGVDSSNADTGPTVASGYGAFALGFGSVASNQGAFAFGVSDSAKGFFAQAFGYLTRSRAILSTTMGLGTIAESAAHVSTASGFYTKTGNWAAVAFGDQTYAKGHTSFATGFKTTASGHTSSTFGEQTTASGYASTAMGLNTTAQAYGSLVIGRYNKISGTPTAWLFWEPLFVIGNGTSSADADRSNAMTVYKSGIADFGGYLNICRNSTEPALYVNSAEALWYNGTYFSWGYGGSYNVFNSSTSIGTTDPPGIYTLYVAGSAYTTGTWNVSDIRWKKNIDNLDNVMGKVLKLNGVSYDWRQDEFPDMHFDSGRQIGLIAQDVEKIYPELVKTDDKGYKAVNYEKLTVILLEGIKEQQKQIEAQNERIQKLEKLVEKNRARK